jgi:hypothetical protein
MTHLWHELRVPFLKTSEVMGQPNATSESNVDLLVLVLFYILPCYGATAQIAPWPPLLRFLNHTQLYTR